MTRKQRFKAMFPWAFYDDRMYTDPKDWVMVTLSILLIVGVIGTLIMISVLGDARLEARMSCPEGFELVDIGSDYLCLTSEFIPTLLDK